MKTIKYILYALTATFVLASCSDDIKYTPGEGEDTDCYGVYFPSQENAGDQELDPAEPTTLTFTAMRKNYNDAITVPVEVSRQFGAQAAGIGITIVIAVVGTLICYGITRLLTGKIRVDLRDELMGLDVSQHGESAYPSFNGLDN